MKFLTRSVILLLFWIHISYAHGGQVVVIPILADLLVLIISVEIVLKENTGWKYRVVVLLGALFSISFSWVIADRLWPDHIQNVLMLAVIYLLALFLFYYPIYLFAKNKLKKESDHH